MTEDPFIEGPRALQEYWCAKTMSAGKQFYVDKVRPFIPVTTAQWVKMPPALQERLDIARQNLAIAERVLRPALVTVTAPK